MYIEPNTTIYLLRGVPLDTSHRNTLYFETRVDQRDYFISKMKYRVTNYTYQRTNKGWVKVNISADKLYACNYMMFQNTNFDSTRWFYAFITKIEYVSNDVAMIQFQIDNVQTWLLSMKLGQCYIDRQHSVTDEKWEHYEPEPVDFGQMVTSSQTLPDVSNQYGSWSDWHLVACVAPDGDSDVGGFVQNGVVSCANYYYCENNSESVNHFLTNVLSDYNQDGVYSVYLFPSVFVGSSTGDNTTHIIDYGRSEPVSCYTHIQLYDTINGYKPKNNKLFSSPYLMFEVTDGCGNSQFYYPELFANSNKITFKTFGKYVGNPEITMIPMGYKGESVNYAESFSIQNFPMASFAADTFRAWVANNGTQVALNTVSNVIGTGVSIASGNVVGTMYNAVGLASSINQVAVAYNQPNKLVTTDNSGMIGTLKEKLPTLKVKCLSDSYMKQVDDFFTMYGYHLSVLDIPNIYARKEFTYIKTNGCIVKGNIPQDAITEIQNCFDNGITWWVNPDNVGNYSVDNGTLD